MVTKAYIKKLPENGDNHYQVRIPYMEDNTGQEVILPALLCNQPGEYGGYQLGDCVFVTFESDKHMDDEAIGDVPVILGKLFIDDSSPVPAYLKIGCLQVVDRVNLPADSKIGKYSTKDIFTSSQASGASLDKISKLQEKIDELLKRVEELERR